MTIIQDISILKDLGLQKIFQKGDLLGDGELIYVKNRQKKKFL